MYITLQKKDREVSKKIIENYWLNITTELTSIKETKTIRIDNKSSTFEKMKNEFNKAQENLDINSLLTQAKQLNILPAEEKYYEFKIAKHSGGLRTITAPTDALKAYQKHIQTLITDVWHIRPHKAAHAYVRKHSTITANEVHQNNKSEWFLKLDLKDFFPSFNEELLIYLLKQVYPFTFLTKETYGECPIEVLRTFLHKGKLPQGTPTSPMITNYAMLPIDFEIDTYCKKHSNNLIYTRYADDLMISAKEVFDDKKVTEAITKIFKNITNDILKINKDKTTFGNNKGKNWHLGILINQENELSLGHRKNRQIRAMVFNYLKDLTNEIQWNIIDLQALLGELSYARSIEPDFIDRTLTTYLNKTGYITTDSWKTMLNLINKSINWRK